MTFPNLPDATLRVARITQRDRRRERAAATFRFALLPVVDLSPLVMAIWSQRTIWGHPVQASLGAIDRKKKK
jgi:hypothetical protein